MERPANHSVPAGSLSRWHVVGLLILALLGFVGCATNRKAERENVVSCPAPMPLPKPIEDPSIMVCRMGEPLTARLSFAKDSAALSADVRGFLDKAVANLKLHPHDTVELAGFTCDLGSEALNLRIAKRRTDAVSAYLIDRGISPKRIRTIVFGEADPLFPNNCEENRAKNRYVRYCVND